jgi:dipeptidyl aminopeptidase/acylaminoacyl peptidase
MDLDAGTTQVIDPWPFSTRHRDALVPMTEVMIPARDGLTLPALLMRPKGVTGPAPLVIEVHGGPAMHDTRQYNHFRQYLANRGYAVLSVNFRGSTGFGRAHQAAGFGTFGRAMQEDLVDAARCAVDQAIADPKAIAIMGASYGGYASALAALRDADTFAAAVVEFPMLDLAYQSQFPPAAWGLGIGEWIRYFGDPANPDALAQMTAHSPVTHAADLSVPMLIHAGRWDRVTGFEQVEAFLAAAGPDAPPDAPIDSLIFDEAGHGLGRWQDNVTRARRIEAFLATHLGGRAEGVSVADLGAKLVK